MRTWHHHRPSHQKPENPSTRSKKCYPGTLNVSNQVYSSLYHSKLYTLLFQWDSDLKDPLLILEWIFLPNQQPNPIITPQELMAVLICRERAHLQSLAGCDFACICMPLATTKELEHLFQKWEPPVLSWQFGSFLGKFSIHLPGHKLFRSTFSLVLKFMLSKTPLKVVTVLLMTQGPLTSQ